MIINLLCNYLLQADSFLCLSCHSCSVCAGSRAFFRDDTLSNLFCFCSGVSFCSRKVSRNDSCPAIFFASALVSPAVARSRALTCCAISSVPLLWCLLLQSQGLTHWHVMQSLPLLWCLLLQSQGLAHCMTFCAISSASAQMSLPVVVQSAILTCPVTIFVSSLVFPPVFIQPLH